MLVSSSENERSKELVLLKFGAPTFIHVFLNGLVFFSKECSYFLFTFYKRFRKPHTYLFANPVQYGFGQNGFLDGSTFVMKGTFWYVQISRSTIFYVTKIVLFNQGTPLY